MILIIHVIQDGASNGEKYSKSVTLSHRVLQRFPSTAVASIPTHTDSPLAPPLSSLTEEEEIEGTEEVDGVDDANIPSSIQIGNVSDLERPTSSSSPTPTANKLSLFFAPEENSFDLFDDQSFDYSDSEDENESVDTANIASMFSTNEATSALMDVEVVEGNDDVEEEEEVDGHVEIDGVDSIDGRTEDCGKPILQRRQSRCLVLPLEGGLQRSALLRSSARRKKKGFWQPLSLTKKHKLRLQVHVVLYYCTADIMYMYICI